MALLVMGATLSITVDSRATSYPASSLELSSTAGRVGMEVTIIGRDFIRCEESGGCSSNEFEVCEPDKNIRLFFVGPLTKELKEELRMEGTTTSANFVELGEPDADDEGYFELRFNVPKFPTGRYFVKPEFGDPLIFRITQK